MEQHVCRFLFGLLGVNVVRFHCVRTMLGGGSVDTVFCQFTCYDDGVCCACGVLTVQAGYKVITCPASDVEGRGEYYDLSTDPYQLMNSFDRLSMFCRVVCLNPVFAGQADVANKRATLIRFRQCDGYASCNFL